MPLEPIDIGVHPGYVVYVLTRKSRDPNTIFYVGRTKNYSRRMSAHRITKGKFHDYIVVVCKTYAASRAIEQAVLSALYSTKIFAIDKGPFQMGQIE